METKYIREWDGTISPIRVFDYDIDVVIEYLDGEKQKHRVSRDYLRAHLVEGWSVTDTETIELG